MQKLPVGRVVGTSIDFKAAGGGDPSGGGGKPTTAPPVLTPGTGSYSGAQSVAMTSATSGAAIHFTQDGSQPTEASPLYASPVTVSRSKTLKAIAAKTGRLLSAITTAIYTIASTGTGTLVMAGDSISAGYPHNTPYADLYAVAASPSIDYTNQAVPGWHIADLVANAAATDALLGTGSNVLLVMIGANDLQDRVTYPTIADWENALAAYLDARRLAGWTVVLLTLLPKAADAGFNANAVTVNAVMVDTWVGVHADVVVDLRKTVMCHLGATSAADTALYVDGIHPTQLGQVYLQVAVIAALDPLLSQAIDTDATAWAAGVVTAGSTATSNQIRYTSSMFKGAKVAGIWTKILWWDICNGNDLTASLVLAKSPTGVRLVSNAGAFVNGDYTPSTGRVGNGTAGGKYLDTAFVPSVELTLYDTHMSVYNRGTISSAQRIHLGAQSDTGHAFNLYAPDPTAHPFGDQYNEASEVDGGNIGAGPWGLITVSCTANAAGGLAIYLGPNQRATGTPAGALVALPLFSYAQNQNGNPNLYSVGPLAMQTIGTGLSPYDVANLDTIATSFNRSLTRAVA